MCNVIKLRNGSKNFQLKVSNGIEEVYSPFDSEEAKLKEQLMREYERGRNDAINSLEQKYKAEYETKLLTEKKQFADLLSSIESELKQYETRFSELVFSVSMAIAKKIIQEEIDQHSPLIKNISSVTQKLIGANYLLIKANPSEIQHIKENSLDLFSEGNFSKIKFEEDSRIEKGGFIIESDIGNIDGQISSQLNEIKKVMNNQIVKTEDE